MESELEMALKAHNKDLQEEKERLKCALTLKNQDNKDLQKEIERLKCALTLKSQVLSSIKDLLADKSQVSDAVFPIQEEDEDGLPFEESADLQPGEISLLLSPGVSTDGKRMGLEIDGLEDTDDNNASSQSVTSSSSSSLSNSIRLLKKYNNPEGKADFSREATKCIKELLGKDLDDFKCSEGYQYHFENSKDNLRVRFRCGCRVRRVVKCSGAWDIIELCFKPQLTKDGKKRKNYHEGTKRTQFIEFVSKEPAAVLKRLLIESYSAVRETWSDETRVSVESPRRLKRKKQTLSCSAKDIAQEDSKAGRTEEGVKELASV